MTLIIPLSSKLEAALRQQATDAGMDVVDYASEVLEQAVTKNGSAALEESADPGPSVYDRLAPVLEQIWSAAPNGAASALKGDEAEVRRLIVEKYRRQGLNP